MGKSTLIWLYNIIRFDCIYLIILLILFYINQFELLIIALSLTIKHSFIHSFINFKINKTRMLLGSTLMYQGYKLGCIHS